jgi:hypothetical protein
MKKTILIMGCFLLGWGASLKAQQGTAASGGEATGAGGTVSYTVGQVDYISMTVTGHGKVDQGIQQAFEIFSVGIDDMGSINLVSTIYPNPAVESLTLRIDGDISGLVYQLYDDNGKLIGSEKIANSETTINMSQLAVARYFIKIINNNKELKTFKVIKLK